MFRIFPVDIAIDRLGDDDHAYSFDWEEDKQYWFDIVHDLAKDRNGMFRREIRMVDPFGRVDRMVIPMNTDIRTIGNLWRNLLNALSELEVQCAMHNELECHWGYREGSAVPLIARTLVSDNNRGNANIYDGSDAFKADQIGRILGVKVPPFAKCHNDVKDARATMRYAGEWIPLGLRVLK
jgi:hypothetical protein